MVRFHAQMHAKGRDAAADAVDRKELDAAWRLVAEMKKQGIYTTLSPYWANAATPIPASWGIAGWPADKAPHGLLFFNEELQRHYKAWWRAILTEPNPYTGVPLAEEPALAILQLQNEDSLLFWTAQDLKGEQGRLLGRKFAEWAARKHGSLDAALRAWGADAAEGDDPASGVLGLHLVWEWTQERSGGRKARLDDQLAFYAETMHGFHAEMVRFLRQELGCKQLVNAGNWKTADALRLDDVERWSYTAGEVVAVNRYYSPLHIGPDNGWRISPGDRYEDLSVLVSPRDFPLALKQPEGHPMLVTESHWVPPLGYQAEGPFLVAAYQSLGGVDGFFWFATGETEWANADRAAWDAASRAKWTVATPMVMGQFPAGALLYRRGYVREAAPVVVERRPLEALWSRALPAIAEDPGYDPNRDLGDSVRRTGRRAGGLDPLAFLVGPVRVAFGGPEGLEVDGLAGHIDARSNVVTSRTGELAWDQGRGVCRLDSPRAQGACGFLKGAGVITLGDVAIRSENAYASVLAVSLDGEPLRSSRRVLVQVGTVARPRGWSVEEAEFTPEGRDRPVRGFRVVSTGSTPWMVEDARVGLTVRSPHLRAAEALDANGMPAGAVAAKAERGAVALRLPKDALYVILHDGGGAGR
jgi:hypothetical protein